SNWAAAPRAGSPANTAARITRAKGMLVGPFRKRITHFTATVAAMSSRLSGYSRTFWVANTLELFERFAYYGSKAILAVYIAEQVGLWCHTATLLAGSVFNTLLYLLPPLAGTIVDRFGFRRSLMACFAIFSLGYFLIGLAG